MRFLALACAEDIRVQVARGGSPPVLALRILYDPIRSVLPKGGELVMV